MDLIELATAEINLFIENISEWFRSDIEGGKEAEAALLKNFHKDFIMITPAGTSMDFTAFSEWLPSAYGARPDVFIEVTDISAHYVKPDCVLMTYTELQYREEGDNKRVASALFVKGEDGKAYWYHLQETWSPLSEN